MRIWSLHPKYLDTKGLLAVWRETLLAKKVLEGNTKGYKEHPQLLRFKQCERPPDAVNQYLMELWNEASARNYHFDKTKIGQEFKPNRLSVTKGQMKYEAQHLLQKLKTRDAKRYDDLKTLKDFDSHTLFEVIEGAVEKWEVMNPNSTTNIKRLNKNNKRQTTNKSTMKKTFIISTLMLLLAANAMAQKPIDLQGVRQISKQYATTGEKDELIKQMHDMVLSVNIIVALRQKYADDFTKNPNDSLANELTNAESRIKDVLNFLGSKFPVNQISSMADADINDALTDAKKAKKLKENPDTIASPNWAAANNKLTDARVALGMMKMMKGENDTAVGRIMNHIDVCKASLRNLKNETRALLPALKPFKPLPDIYKGADKDTLEAKVKSLFEKECKKYSVSKVFLVSEDWAHNSPVEWDETSKSYIKADRSSLEVNIVCVKNDEPDAAKAFLVSFWLVKDTKSGKLSDTLLCDDVEEKPIVNQ